MKRLLVVSAVLIIVALMAAALSGCATAPSAPTAYPTAAPTTTSTPYESPTYTEEPTETSTPEFTPNEAGYLRASLKAWGLPNTMGKSYNSMLIDLGWSVCSMLDSGDLSVLEATVPRPSRRAALIKASTTYLCPDK